MKLLTFAHRGEARAFLDASDYKPVEFFFDGLFKNDDSFLLITGEGTLAASEKTMAVLTSFQGEIKEVFNIGVAGSLNPKCSLHDLIWVRTSYAHHAERLEFKSFTSITKLGHFDCMTAYTRILAKEERQKLSQFASLVDRELWAVASAATFFKKPYQALKIISDDQTLIDPENHDICKFVKEEAPLLSEKLFQEFQSQIKNSLTSKNQHNISGNRFLDNSDFYFTTSQERKLQSLCEGLRLKQIDINSLDLSPITSLENYSEKLPKERTRLLLQLLNDRLNPFAKKIRETIEENIITLKEAGIQTSYDSEFEQDWIQLSMKIQSSRDLEKTKNALKIFSYEDFKKIFDGNIGLD